MNAENIVVHFLSFVAWISMAFFLSGYRRSYLELIEGLTSLRSTGNIKAVEKPSVALISLAKSIGIAIQVRNSMPHEDEKALNLAALAKFLFLLKCDRLEVEYDLNDRRIALLIPRGTGISDVALAFNDTYFKVNQIS